MRPKALQALGGFGRGLLLGTGLVFGALLALVLFLFSCFTVMEILPGGP